MSGTLYVVATPIGNLEDLSPRARRILGEVSLVAAEDTRTARNLLEHCGVHAALLSVHDHNEAERLPQLITRLEAEEDIALVSEAGIPGVSDPGFRLVREAQRVGIRVVGIPGPCAAVTALSIAGLPTDRFLFLGFLPSKRTKRRAALSEARAEAGTLVLYESPQRILEMLEDIEAELPGREVALARELTKVYEEVLRGSPAEVRARLEANDGEKLRGEMTLLIEGAGHRARSTAAVQLSSDMGVKQLAEQVASILGVPRRDAYKALTKLRNSAIDAGPEPEK